MRSTFRNEDLLAVDFQMEGVTDEDELFSGKRPWERHDEQGNGILSLSIRGHYIRETVYPETQALIEPEPPAGDFGFWMFGLSNDQRRTPHNALKDFLALSPISMAVCDCDMVDE